MQVSEFLNFESKFLEANKKNRRVLGLSLKSISFRTHQRDSSKHTSLTLPLVLEGKEYLLKVPLMAYLTRLYILQLADSFINSGAHLCRIYDQNQLKSQGLLPSEDLQNPKDHSLLYNSDLIREYYQSLPEVISFNLYEYEKQILYLRGFVEDHTIVKQLRYLYHADLSALVLPQTNLSLIAGLFYGLHKELLQQVIVFSRYE